MTICSRSLHNRAPGVLLLFAAFSPALGQHQADVPVVREHGEANTKDALKRVMRAASGEDDKSRHKGPSHLPDLPESERRRAFEGLQRRARPAQIERRAASALDQGKEALARQREAMSKRLGQALGLEPPETQALASTLAPPGASGWVPVLFVSSSMPVAVLRTYASQLEAVGGVLAFRGMPGGLSKVGRMARLSALILRRDPGCEGPACVMRNVQLIVDPLIFRAHAVTRVPALAMLPGDPAQPYCEREDEAAPTATHLVYGDAALSGLFEQYARLGGRKEVADAQARLGRR
jgi:type-F conjugative transfer system pilin assembly protein TrbC